MKYWQDIGSTTRRTNKLTHSQPFLANSHTLSIKMNNKCRTADDSPLYYSGVQSRIAVYAYFISRQILHFGFPEHYGEVCPNHDTFLYFRAVLLFVVKHTEKHISAYDQILIDYFKHEINANIKIIRKTLTELQSLSLEDPDRKLVV